MINFIVEVDDKTETKELIDFLKKHHRTMRFCEECAYNIDNICQVHQIAVLDDDFCSSSFPKLKNLSKRE